MRASYDQAKREHLLRVSEDELAAINNALNEVCNGVDIDDREFQTRLGVTRHQLQRLLTQIRSAADQGGCDSPCREAAPHA
jgi:hypothetical protein